MLGRVSWHGGFQKCGARGGAKIEGRELRDGLTVVCEPGTCPCYRKNDDRPPEPREAHRHGSPHGEEASRRFGGVTDGSENVSGRAKTGSGVREMIWELVSQNCRTHATPPEGKPAQKLDVL
jgi:hypothetical protein